MTGRFLKQLSGPSVMMIAPPPMYNFYTYTGHYKLNSSATRNATSTSSSSSSDRIENEDMRLILSYGAD